MAMLVQFRVNLSIIEHLPMLLSTHSPLKQSCFVLLSCLSYSYSIPPGSKHSCDGTWHLDKPHIDCYRSRGFEYLDFSVFLSS